MDFAVRGVTCTKLHLSPTNFSQNIEPTNFSQNIEPTAELV